MGYSKENGVVPELVSLVGLATLSRRFYVGLAQVRDFCPAPIRNKSSRVTSYYYSL